MQRKTLLAIVVLAGSVALGAQTTLAQQHRGGMSGTGQGRMGGGMMGGDGTMGGGGMMGRGGMMRGGGMMGGGCPMMGMGGSQDTHMAGRIAFLKAELAITDAQKGAFDTYAEAIKANIENMHAMREGMMSMMSAENPVERLDAHLTMMEKRTASLKAVKPALTALYSALDDTQKKKANAILTGMGCMM
jgi:hypothetical protein